jgi:Mn2+/Fe2+ NRAMP family transporter
MTVAIPSVFPHLSWNGGYVTTVVAVFGTTISPYLFFWQASHEVGELLARHGQRAFKHAPSQGATNLKRIKFDTWFGMRF